MIFIKKATTVIGLLTLLLTPALVHAQVADFQADVTSGCPPSLTVRFTDKSTGNPLSWEWDFGNGNTSSFQNPTAVYTQPGTYTVKLKVSGGNTITKTSYIVLYEKPTIAFSSDVTSGCVNLDVKFTNASTAGSGNIKSYAWVFGDGDVSSDPNPIHTYIAPSVFSVTLTVTNQYNCSNSLVKSALIDAKGPRVDFTSGQTNFCLAPAKVDFANNTTGVAPITYQWDFGDNSTSTDAIPSHTYTKPGSYQVRLTATDGNGCSYTKTKPGFVLIGNEPGVKFSISSSKVCIGQTVRITNETSVPVLSHLWDLGNGKQSSDVNTLVSYEDAGIYDITLKALLPSGCEILITKKVEVIEDATADFKTTPSCKRKITFENLSKHAASYYWEFGDGKTSIEKNPVHTYPAEGTFKLKFTAYNELNCPTKIEREITVDGDPVATIIPSAENSCTDLSLAGCAPFTMQFVNGTKGTVPITSTFWTFGDNTNSSLKSPAHLYTNAGSYNVMMVVTNARNCRDTARAVVKVSSTIPKADFKVNKTNVCVSDTLTFSYLFAKTDAELLCWDFGDGSSESIKTEVGLTISHKYKKPGTYTVMLTAKNAGCSTTSLKQDLIIVKDPYLEFEVAKICSTPYDITLVNSSTNFDIFSWDFGDGNTDNIYSDNIRHHFQSAGIYEVSLKIKNSATGCEIIEKKQVTIQEIKADFQPEAYVVCKNDSINFTDKSKFATGWQWNFGGGVDDISALQSPTKIFSTPGIYTVRLSASDSEGCRDNKTVSIKVADIDGKFSTKATSTCTDFNVDFTDTSAAFPAVETWLWDFGDGATSTDKNPNHTYHQLDKYPVKLTLQNSEATCTVLVTDAIVFTNPSADFSVSKDLVCLNEVITFSNKSTLAQTYLWDFGNNKTMTDLRPVMSYDQPGKFTVVLKVKDEYGCEKSITKTNVVEVSKPIAKFEAAQTSAECPPLISTFFDKSSSDVTDWFWDFGNGQNSILQNPTFTYEVPGVYDVSLAVANKAGCISRVKVEGLVSLNGPYGSFVASSVKSCINDQISFTATTTNTAKYIWDFGDGIVLENDQSQVNHIYTNVADVNLSLTLVDNKGCKVVVSKGQKISVKGRPEIDFDFATDYAFEGEPVLFTAAVKEQLELLWTFDTEATPGGEQIEKAFENYGPHHVILKAVTKDGCDSSVAKDLTIQENIKMIPNVFTPNEDEFNPTFIIDNVEHGSWMIKVYNRWGQLVHSESEYKSGWDGGNLSPGVYYYLLKNNYRPATYYKGYVQIME